MYNGHHEVNKHCTVSFICKRNILDIMYWSIICLFKHPLTLKLYTVQLEGNSIHARGCVCRIAQVAMRALVYMAKPMINIA